MSLYRRTIRSNSYGRLPDYNLDPPDYDEDLEERLQIEKEERLAAELEEEEVN